MSGPDLRGGGGPERAGIVLVTLILVAAVANLNLSVANVALPSIGEAFDSSQVTLNLIAVGYSLGLAASVLYLGALGDRYGRKMMLVLGTALAIPMSLSSNAPTEPSASLLTNARSMIRIVFDSTSFPRAGAMSPVNRLPGNDTIMYSTGPISSIASSISSS